MNLHAKSNGDPTKIALLMSITHGFSQNVFQGLCTYVRPIRSWNFHFAQAHPETIDKLKTWRPDGIIAVLPSVKFARQLLSFDVPVVNCGGEVPDIEGIPRVDVDNRAVGGLAAEYLIRRGFSHLAYCGETGRPSMIDRGNGFRQALADAGMDCHEYSHWSKGAFDDQYEWQWSSDISQLLQWLIGLPKPVGIFACHDYIAMLVNMTCREAGLKVPDEVAVLGVDNDEVLCQMIHPTLSSIQTPQEKIGFEVGHMLNSLIRDRESAPDSILLPPVSVITRQSTDITATNDPELASAIRYIREHADQPIRVTDVLNTLIASRRSLETRFKSELGRTILDEIQISHIDRAKHLLTETGWPLEKVAEASGFNSRERLSVVFRRISGVSPAKFRRQASASQQ